MTGHQSTTHGREYLRMFSASQCVRWVVILVAAVFGAMISGTSHAQTVNVSLNVRYTTPGVPTSGCIYQLVARSTHFGLSGLDVYLTGVNEPTESMMPRGIVNGEDEAGFSI